MSKIKLTHEKIQFFNDKTTTNPTVSLLPGSSATDEENLILRLPDTLPSDNTENVISVDKDTGQMSYKAGFDSSSSTLSSSGTYESESDGAVGITTGSTIDTTMTKLDTWIFRNLVDKPPAPTNLQFAENSTTTITLTWDAPTIYQLGILAQTIPYITDLNIKIYKADTSSANLSGTVTHTASSKTLTGSGTSFTGLTVGDSITVPGALWTSGTPKVKGASQTGTTLVTDGWTADPASFSNAIFIISGHYSEYKISSLSGSWVDATTEITLNLDRSLTASPNDDAGLTNQETKVITAIASDTSLTVDSNYSTAVSSGQTASHISYSSTSQSIQITDTDYIPREDSSTIIEAFRFYIDAGSTGTDGTINSKNIYSTTDSPTIVNTDKLKFEIYYGNHNSALTNNIAYIANQEFITPGVPVAPTSLSTSDSATSLSVSWTAPVDNDNNSAGNNTTPAIDSYKITYESSSLSSGINRYNSASNSIAHVVHGSQDTTSSSASKSLTNLHCGQSYSISIRAKNTINSDGGDNSDGYGAALSGTGEITTLPTTTSKLNSFSLSNPSTTYTNDNNARTLGAHTQLSHKILDSNSLGTWIQYSTLTNVGVNVSQSALTTAEVQFQPLFGTNGSTSNDGTATSFKSFDNPHTHANSGTTTTNTNTKIKLYNQEDKYSDTYQEGFWSQLDIDYYAKVSSTPASESNYYTVGLKHIVDSSDQSSISTDNFYVDDLNNNPSINAVSSASFTDSNQFDISGIPSRGDGFQVTYNFDVQYLGRYFLRYDKLAIAYLRFNNSNISSATTFSPSGITSWNYSDSAAVSAPIDTSKYVRLSETITYNSTDIHTNSNKISLKITPYNIKATGSAYEEEQIDGSDVFVSSGGKFIYVDTVSKNILDTYYGKSATGSSTRVNYPVRRILNSNNSANPSVSSSSDHAAYDNSQIIVGNSSDTDYNYELQFVNGRLRTGASSDAFLDYTTYLDHASKTMTDYSGATADEFRYCTFQFDLSGNTQKNINSFDIIFNNYTLASSVASSGVVTTTEYQLYIKLIDNGNYSPDGSDYSSIWLDGNAILSGAVGRTKTNYSNSALEPLAVLENSSTGNTNTTDTKRIILASGTDTDNLVVLVRLGLKNNVDNSMGYLTLEYDYS
tara:strand:- start:1574 stop:4984 length:3411 start_codon:yes stop_codon:yes gene_type:complete